MKRQLDEAQFLKDVAGHKMTVLREDGLYRHLRFASTGPNSWNQWFQIVTWPGFLAYSGDMGCYVFSRIEDMFAFFRTRPADDKNQLYINTGYWAEKLQSVDRDHRNNSEMAFSEDLFREKVQKHVNEWIADHDGLLHDVDLSVLRDSIEDEVFSSASDGEHYARQALNDFKFESESGEELKFQDTWEWEFREYTGRYLWCCYAIVWAIQQYDAQKQGSEAAA